MRTKLKSILVLIQLDHEQSNLRMNNLKLEINEEVNKNYYDIYKSNFNTI